MRIPALGYFFFESGQEEKLTAKASCVKEGRSVASYRVDVTDDLDNLIAIVTVTGYHVGG